MKPLDVTTPLKDAAAPDPTAKAKPLRGKALFKAAARKVMGVKVVTQTFASLKAKATKADRYITVFEADKDKRNAVKTTKYNIITFLPLNIFEQLTQVANFYFMVIACLECIPAISNSGGIPMTLMPLSFVLFIGALKDGVEDYRRYKHDKLENESRCIMVDTDLEKKEGTWGDLRPGMLFRVEEGERLPADGLILDTDKENGECFVETANLDGETNLKKKAPIFTQKEWIDTYAAIKKGTKIELGFESPNTDLYQFRGAIMLPNGEARGASSSNLLLRGTSLQQTGWCLCLCTYAGPETRSMMNSRGSTFKKSKLEIDMGFAVLMIFCIELITCASLSIISIVWGDIYNDLWYMPSTSIHPFAKFFISTGTWLVQLSGIVPVSVMVTMATVKFIQAMFVPWDKGCGDPATGDQARVNTSAVIESLGQVTHIFSDKTGTLTQNVMEYRACTVAGKIYGLGPKGQTEEEKNVRIKQGKHLEVAHCSFDCEGYNADMSNKDSTEQAEALAFFFLNHALCHTVEASGLKKKMKDDAQMAAEKSALGHDDEGGGAVIRGGSIRAENDEPYKASSPDELALVCGAKALGLEFVGATPSKMQLSVTGEDMIRHVSKICGWTPKGTRTTDQRVNFDILDICEFDNDRKRMSIVLRFPSGQIMLFVKGADTSVLPYLDKTNDAQLIETTQKHLSVFANVGLRTLCLAARPLGQAEYEAWHERYAAALAVVSDDHNEKVRLASEEIEVKGPPLKLLGCTAIDDKLQVNVADTIAQVRYAGIRVWVLTGDKVETAISIAWSCALLDETMTNIVLESDKESAIVKAIDQIMKTKKPALTISAVALKKAMETESLIQRFVEATNICAAVVCCRVSPKQKADVVQMVKTNIAGCVTLAIGDGANDVAMIVTAHVGVGLSGKEGAQAASTADFAIKEFRFLRRLLFVYGRECYRKGSYIVLYNFYKNMLLVMPTAMLGFVSGASGTTLFSNVGVQMYNVLYTNLTVFAYGIFDRSAPNLDDLERDPSGFATMLFSNSIQFVWVAAAIVQAACLNYLCLLCFQYGQGGEGGAELDGLTATGDIRFVWVVCLANLGLARIQECWFWWSWLVYLFNIVTLILTCWYNGTGNYSKYQTWHAFFGPDFIRLVLVSILVFVSMNFVLEILHGNARTISGWMRAIFGERTKIPSKLPFNTGPKAARKEGEEHEEEEHHEAGELRMGEEGEDLKLVPNNSRTAFAFAAECFRERGDHHNTDYHGVPATRPKSAASLLLPQYASKFQKLVKKHMSTGAIRRLAKENAASASKS